MKVYFPKEVYEDLSDKEKVRLHKLLSKHTIRSGYSVWGSLLLDTVPISELGQAYNLGSEYFYEQILKYARDKQRLNELEKVNYAVKTIKEAFESKQ